MHVRSSKVPKVDELTNVHIVAYSKAVNRFKAEVRALLLISFLMNSNVIFKPPLVNQFQSEGNL